MTPSSIELSVQATLQQVGRTVPLLHCWAIRQNSKLRPTASALMIVPEEGLTMSLPLSTKNFCVEFLSRIMQVSLMGSQLLEQDLRIYFTSVTSAWMQRLVSNFVVPFLMMKTSLGGVLQLRMYSLSEFVMMVLILVFSSSLDWKRQLEQKEEKSLEELAQYEMIFLPPFSESFVVSMPMNMIPELCTFEEILGTHSLFPTFADIWSKILVKIEAKPFFSRLDETVT